MFVVIDEPGSLGKGKAESYPLTTGSKRSRVEHVYLGHLYDARSRAYSKYIPRQTTGQTSHLIRFHLMNDDDSLARARLLGVPQ